MAFSSSSLRTEKISQEIFDMIMEVGCIPRPEVGTALSRILRKAGASCTGLPFIMEEVTSGKVGIKIYEENGPFLPTKARHKVIHYHLCSFILAECPSHYD
jgi:hypothetical protein